MLSEKRLGELDKEWIHGNGGDGDVEDGNDDNNNKKGK